MEKCAQTVHTIIKACQQMRLDRLGQCTREDEGKVRGGGGRWRRLVRWGLGGHAESVGMRVVQLLMS